MPKAPILGGKGDVSLDDAVFAQPFHPSLVHETVRAEQAARRQGTHASRNRALIRGGGIKPFRQKGTGRARQGSTRAPQMTGGAAVFGPSPRHYTFKINRKERAAALRSALSVHAARGSVAVFDPAPFDKPSTKAGLKLLSSWDRKGATLMVLSDEQELVSRSFRNLEKTRVLPVSQVGVADLIRAANLVLSQEALDALTTRASRVPRSQGAGA
ncbi:MAG: 50S ribosomal protein L4 [Solirubrobacteraceae bacterium]|nr:50S ribosomal protein L4 [Solirubrobacteraceae bacterium]